MNKTFFKSILFVGLAACMFSCKDDNSPLDGGNTPQGVNVKFDYSQAKLGKSVGSSATLNASSDVDWTIEVEEGDFFSVEPMSGKAGDFTLTVTANKENTSTDKAYSKFIFNASGRKYPITVIHLEDDIRLEPSYDAETVFSFAQNGTLLSPDLTAKAFTATSNIEWTVKTVNEADTWIKVGPEVGEIGENLPVTVVVDENPFAKVREGKFEVRVPEAMSFQYTVTQAAAPLDYKIKDGEKVLTEQAGLTGLGGGGETRTITLNANADWKIEPGTDSEWLTFEPSEGTASLEPVEVKVMVEPNPNMDDVDGRNGSFTVTFGEGTSKEISVQQNKGEMPKDVTALKALEATLEGSSTDALNWSTQSDYKKWTGVTLSGGNLVKLDLSNKNLSGTIPMELVNFESLDYIDLSGNNLTGSIPAELATLKATTFKVSGNQLEGKVAADFADNANYESWNAMVNIYPQQGDISDSNDENYNPKNWKLTLSDAGVMRIMYKKLDGKNWVTQPSWLTQEIITANSAEGIVKVDPNGQVQELKMSKDVFALVGELPMELSMLKALYKVEFQNNDKLTGVVHKAYMQNLTYINFSQCRITMEINDFLSLLKPEATHIMVMNQGGKITGTEGLKDEIITKFTKIKNLSIKGNALSGTISRTVQDFFNNYNGSGKLKINNVDWDDDTNGWILPGNNFTLAN